MYSLRKFLFIKPLLLLLPPLLLDIVIHLTFDPIELSAQTRSTTNLKLQTLVIPNEFSISYPASWFVDHSSSADAIPRESVIITSLKPPRIGSHDFPDNLIKTDIDINPGSFTENLSQIDEGLKDDGSKITRRGRTVVGGREAYRVWFSEPNANAIITIISYKQDETIYIASFYSHQNPAAIPIIQRIQGSFRTQQ